VNGDAITEVLRRHSLRVTPQRRAILQAFRGTGDEHLSAEEVASRASVTVPNIGRGTVYATLAELTELGLLASVGNAEPIRFETNLAAHDHFRCRLCLRLFDVELGGPELRKRRSLPGFRIESIAVEADGICASCQDYQRGLRDGAAQALSMPSLAQEDFDGLSCVRLDSPVGELALVASTDGVVHLAFSEHADFASLIARARARRGAVAARGRLTELTASLEDYFSGSPVPLTDVIDWRMLSSDQRGALLSVQRIPWHGSCSYEQLDSTLDPYACGRLMGCNPLPLLIPCHRVTCGSERPEVYVGGTERLHALWALEDG